jgi:hypothetical protein
MLRQKCLSTGISSNLTQGIRWHRLPACADKGLNLEDITLIFFHKDRLENLRVINAAPTFNRLLHRLPACATNLKCIMQVPDCV